MIVPIAHLSIRAVPNAGRNACAGMMDDGTTWKIRLAAPAVDGRANAALIECLAEFLHVPRGKIEITAGTSNRSKRVRVDGLSLEEASVLLAAAAEKR